MKQYLLDTNICIYLLKNQYDVVNKIEEIGRENCFISEITLAELYFGASNSGKKTQKMRGVHYIEQFFTVLPIRYALESFGDNKTLLRQKGMALDDFDLLIGSTAVANNLIMVTENTKHLSRIPKIKIENWIER